MASDYGRRQQAFQDIFARPVANPNGAPRQSPQPPSHASLQMTPAHYDPQWQQQQQYNQQWNAAPADRRASFMSTASSGASYPYYPPNQPQAGPSRIPGGYASSRQSVGSVNYYPNGPPPSNQTYSSGELSPTISGQSHNSNFSVAPLRTSPLSTTSASMSSGPSYSSRPYPSDSGHHRAASPPIVQQRAPRLPSVDPHQGPTLDPLL